MLVELSYDQRWTDRPEGRYFITPWQPPEPCCCCFNNLSLSRKVLRMPVLVFWSLPVENASASLWPVTGWKWLIWFMYSKQCTGKIWDIKMLNLSFWLGFVLCFHLLSWLSSLCVQFFLWSEKCGVLPWAEAGASSLLSIKSRAVTRDYHKTWQRNNRFFL